MGQQRQIQAMLDAQAQAVARQQAEVAEREWQAWWDSLTLAEQQEYLRQQETLRAAERERQRLADEEHARRQREDERRRTAELTAVEAVSDIHERYLRALAYWGSKAPVGDLDVWSQGVWAFEALGHRWPELQRLGSDGRAMAKWLCTHITDLGDVRLGVRPAIRRNDRVVSGRFGTHKVVQGPAQRVVEVGECTIWESGAITFTEAYQHAVYQRLRRQSPSATLSDVPWNDLDRWPPWSWAPLHLRAARYLGLDHSLSTL